MKRDLWYLLLCVINSNTTQGHRAISALRNSCCNSHTRLLRTLYDVEIFYTLHACRRNASNYMFFIKKAVPYWPLSIQYAHVRERLAFGGYCPDMYLSKASFDLPYIQILSIQLVPSYEQANFKPQHDCMHAADTRRGDLQENMHIVWTTEFEACRHRTYMPVARWKYSSAFWAVGRTIVLASIMSCKCVSEVVIHPFTSASLSTCTRTCMHTHMRARAYM